MKHHPFHVFPALALGVLFPAAVFASVYTWTGAGDGKTFSDVANWDGDPFLAAEQTLRFTNSVSVVVDKAGTTADGGDASMWPAVIQVTSGDVYLCKGKGEHYLKSKNVVIDVAKDAHLVESNGYLYFYYGTFTKKGEGTLTFASCPLVANMNAKPVWDPVTVEAGTMELVDAAAVYASNVVVKAGAKLVCADVATQVSPSLPDSRVTLEEGAELVLGCGAIVGGLDGAGVVTTADGAAGAWLQIKGAAPNCTFTGTFPTNCTYVFSSGPNPFVVQRAEQLKGVKAITDGSSLRFKRGVGVFETGTLYGKNSAPFYLQDEDGNAVTVRAPVENSGYMKWYGPGDLIVITNALSRAPSPIIYGNTYHATGAVGAGAGVYLYMGCNNMAQHDVDYSGAGISRLVGEGGTFAFVQHAQADVAVPVVGQGRLAVYNGGLKLRAADFVSPGTDGRATDLSARFELAGGTLTTPQLIGSFYPLEKHDVQRISGGRLAAGASVLGHSGNLNEDAKTFRPWPNGVEVYGYKGWFSLEMTGGEFWWKGGNGLKNLFLRGGDVYALSQAIMSTTPGALSDGGDAQVVFDGGRLVLFDRDGGAAQYSFLGVNDHVVYVTERGGRVHAWEPYMQNCNREFAFYAPVTTCTNVLVDGGLEFTGAAAFAFRRPVSLKGPLRFHDGTAKLHPNQCADGDAPFGTGDFVLRNAALRWDNNWSETKDVAIAGGDGSAFALAGAAAIQFRNDDAKPVQHLRSRALRVDAKGAALFLRTEGTDVLGAGSTFKLDVPPETNAAGVVLAPVLAAGSTTRDFTAYDAEKGFVPYAGYAMDFSADATKPVKLTDYKTVSSDAAALGVCQTASWATLAINGGVRLRLGDDVHPAFVTLGVASRVLGAGTLDFGGSEGVFVPNNTTGVPGDHRIACTLAGTGGITFIAPPLTEHDFKFVLDGANVHAGGTFVNGPRVLARNHACFGTGPVVVGGGSTFGGNVVLCVGGTWTNDFRLAGYGPGARNHALPAALALVADTTLSGAVELVEPARIAVTNGATATLAGVVSGDRLQVFDVSLLRGGCSYAGTLALAAANVYTGGTEIVKATVALACNDAAGTGAIRLDDGTLAFVNDAPVVFTNAVEGVGRIVLAGTAPVTFTDRSLAALPFKTLAPGSAFAFPATDAAADFVAWVDEKTGLDLGGKDRSVAGLAGSGRVFGGTLTVTGEINPGGAGALGTLAFAQPPVVDGAVYVCDLVGTSADKIVVEGAFALDGLSFRAVRNPGAETTRATVAAAEDVTGAFAAATLPKGRWRLAVGADKVELIHNVGTTIIVR